MSCHTKGLAQRRTLTPQPQLSGVGKVLEGLEIVPRRRLEYRGGWFEEMDVYEGRRLSALFSGALVTRPLTRAAKV